MLLWNPSALTTAAAQNPTISVALHAGTCAVPDVVVAPLTPASLPTGPHRGNAQAQPVATSSTTIPVSLADLGGRPHAVVVSSPAEERVLACGEIAGPLARDGALVIGLNSVPGAALTGIAYLRPVSDPRQTTIALFMTETDHAAGARPSSGSPLLAGASSAPPSRGVVVVAVGDIACGQATPPTAKCHQMSTARLAEEVEPDAVLLLGDTQYECGDLADFEAFFDPSWGRLKAVTHPAIGHHEYAVNVEIEDEAVPCADPVRGAPGYWSYFGDAATPLEPGCRLDCLGYYSFNLGTWHVIALNSVCQRGGGCEAGSAQERWLRADLAASSAPCTLAYMHDPRFNSGRSGDDPDMEPFWQALFDFGADLVLAAHDHHYERFAPLDPEGRMDPERGLRSFIVGTGGRSHLKLPPERHPASEAADDTTFGILRLDLHDGWYEWAFIPVIDGSPTAFTDHGSARCHE